MLLQLLAMLGLVGLTLLLGMAWACTAAADEAALDILPDRQWLALITVCHQPVSTTRENHLV